MSWASQETRKHIQEIAERVAASEGIEVLEVEYRGSSRQGFVRVFIDRPEGIFHKDCELVSRQLGTILEVEDVLRGSYRLEVSSPGLERKLYKGTDYERFTGKKVRITLRQPREGRKQFTGQLGGIAKGTVLLEAGGGEALRFPLEDIETARLVAEF